MTKRTAAGGQSLLISGALKMARSKKANLNNINLTNHHEPPQPAPLTTSILDNARELRAAIDTHHQHQHNSPNQHHPLHHQHLHNHNQNNATITTDPAPNTATTHYNHNYHIIHLNESASNSSTESMSSSLASPSSPLQDLTMMTASRQTGPTTPTNNTTTSTTTTTTINNTSNSHMQHSPEQHNKQQVTANSPQINGKNKKLFPQKLWDLINDERYSFCLRWSDDGQLVYLNRDEFEDSYLKTAENQFHTQKAISFVRQMNMYGFRKVDDCYYENDNFKRGCEYLLKNMTRKHPNKTSTTTIANNGASSAINTVNNTNHHHGVVGPELSNFLYHKSQIVSGIGTGAGGGSGFGSGSIGGGGGVESALDSMAASLFNGMQHDSSKMTTQQHLNTSSGSPIQQPVPDLQQPVDLRCAMQQQEQPMSLAAVPAQPGREQEFLNTLHLFRLMLQFLAQNQNSN